MYRIMQFSLSCAYYAGASCKRCYVKEICVITLLLQLFSFPQISEPLKWNSWMSVMCCQAVRDSDWQMHSVITQHITNKTLSFYSRSLLLLLFLLLLLLLSLSLSASSSSSSFLLLLLLLHHCSHGHWMIVKASFHYDTKTEVPLDHWRETGLNV